MRPTQADGLEAFECRGIDGVDRRPHQDQVTHLRAIGDHLEDVFLEPARVEIRQAFIDPNGDDPRISDDIVPVDVSKVPGVRNPAHDRSVRSGRARQH